MGETWRTMECLDVSSIRNRRISLCVAHGCCWDGLMNRCNCESGSRSFWRGKRTGKIQVDLSLPNCNCKGYEMGGHGRGPRPVRVYTNKIYFAIHSQQLRCKNLEILAISIVLKITKENR
ncbi:Hypothetical predicted protein [Mytilus galloprovincialis]|uniref:Uncharacterized protein n=1 Tax=Mytilus galloprovincialis TaxID=29158 RepID=A0A8B6BF81_MYTGA|nr:Hypothetical predicted protein [Mytilus galloprovincialis]